MALFPGVIRRMLFANGGDVTTANPLPVSGGAGGFVPVGVAGTPNAAVVSVQGVTGGTPAPVVLTQGFAAAGYVGGFGAIVQVTPVVQAAAYVTGNMVGGLLTFANAARVAASSGLVQAASVSFLAGVLPALDLILFNANPSASTLTDRTQVVIATADLPKIVGVAHLLDTTLLGAAAPSLIQGLQLAIPFKLPAAGTSLFAALVARASFTLGSVSDATVSIRLIQD